MEQSEDEKQAIAAVANSLAERAKAYPGFDFVLIYATPTQLIGLNPFFSAVATSGNIKEFGTRFFEFIKGYNLGMVLITSILYHSVTKDGSDDISKLATRIYYQMLDDEEVDPKNIRKPTYHAAIGERGIAIALAIDDRFWTEEW